MLSVLRTTNVLLDDDDGVVATVVVGVDTGDGVDVAGQLSIGSLKQRRFTLSPAYPIHSSLVHTIDIYY